METMKFYTACCVVLACVFCLWNRFFLSALPGSPRPPCTMQKYPFAVPQGRVFAGCKAAERTARGNGTTYRFFLLPYGVMAENQSFNNRLANDLLIDIKTNPLELIKVRKNV